MPFDFEHDNVCPNREAKESAFREEQRRAEIAEKSFVEAISPVSCAHCGQSSMRFFENAHVDDPCLIVRWRCLECGLQLSELDPRVTCSA
jgi:transposase-like protein